MNIHGAYMRVFRREKKPADRADFFGLFREVGEGAVGFGHAVHVLLFLHGVTLVLRRVHDFHGELFGHWLAFTRASGVDHPAESELNATIGTHLKRNLVVCTTNTLGLDFNRWTDVLHGLVKEFHGGFLHFFFNDLKGGVYDLLSRRLFSVFHDAVHELANHLRIVLRIIGDGPTWGLFSSHNELLGLTDLDEILDADEERSKTYSAYVVEHRNRQRRSSPNMEVLISYQP